MNFSSLCFLLCVSTATAFRAAIGSSGLRPATSLPMNAFRADIDRRNLLQGGAAALLSALLGPQLATASEPQTIVITGSNSGIGFEASKLLAEKGHTVILGCRTLEKAKNAADRIREDVSSGTLLPAECDLASLESVRKFAKDLPSSQIDVLCLNAGLALNTKGDIERTVDGFERTVGINHLGHFYLHHLLLPKIKPAGGRIVVTASSVHDPESPGGKQGIPASLGNLEGFEKYGRDFEMVDGGAYNGDKAYKDSKLCNVLFTRELQRRLEANDATKSIVANCFSPGLITSSGFFRYQSPVFSKAFGFVAEKVARVAETPEWGGGCLAYMTTVDSRAQFWDSPPGSSKYGDAAYGKQFTTSEISKEAKDDAKAKRLWELSEKLVGISA
mmetsp:Transcript_133697/g.387068  ORF Transcript_133697/g.387068 Transcript_133697/m.387068 type:complete len:388 (-) Transcript_133697:24-1187(-)|eukprot:CAMPEP_0176015852 /NCGR_PEP_ID=MMETSP0120_2-20121206/7550_1 /TAXON_ID=160619 /ORGANISM="Kryptoperidinium foliaceum, Strain CCMP 1326" /LENGTH=387 /DNA_ID=CAMNT_0017348833 /DNA_START=105 /DNA_END=1268 /DNA_ORIENTATION=-